jgi:hypothetical protein
MNRCGNCGSSFVRPTRPAWWQALRARVTRARPHECWHCGWTGWLPPEPPQSGIPLSPVVDTAAEADRTAAPPPSATSGSKPSSAA